MAADDAWMTTLMAEITEKSPYVSHKARDAVPERLVLGGFVLNQYGHVLYRDEPALDSYPRVVFPDDVVTAQQTWRLEYYLHNESVDHAAAPWLRVEVNDTLNRKREHKAMHESCPVSDNTLWVRADASKFAVLFEKKRDAWKLSKTFKYTTASRTLPRFVFVAIPCNKAGKPDYSKAIRTPPFAVKSKRQPKETAARAASTRAPKRTRRTAETEQLAVQIRDVGAEIVRLAAENKRLRESNQAAMQNSELFLQIAQCQPATAAFHSEWSTFVEDMRRRFH